MSTQTNLHYSDYKGYEFHIYKDMHEPNENAAFLWLTNGEGYINIYLPLVYANHLIDFLKIGESEFVKEEGINICITPYSNNACISFALPIN